ncbi:MAG: cobalt-precorrin-6A reductase [Ilumatobacteraceae bacterium]
MPRVLLLAGTTEATVLAGRLVALGAEVISSLAGVTRSPVGRAGLVRSGGFGGVEGLVRYLVEQSIDAVIDATHPFAAVMPFHAAAAAAAVQIPRCRLLRPAWQPVEGDRWVPVTDIEAAIVAVSREGARRVFLTVGRQTAGAFAACRDVQFLVRAIEPIAGVLAGAEVVLQRGPFGLEDEIALLSTHGIDTIVAKNSGGTATAPKLAAARQLGIRVIMIDRPAQPAGPVTQFVEDAVDWFERLSRAALRT